jgi:hypothetical protein
MLGVLAPSSRILSDPLSAGNLDAAGLIGCWRPRLWRSMTHSTGLYTAQLRVDLACGGANFSALFD